MPGGKKNNISKTNIGGEDFDAIIDSALSNVQISDVVRKLEEIDRLYKIRELPRQLTITDLMLNSLGLSSLFPELNEALTRSLDSSTYVSTRLQNILSRLRGAMGPSDNIDLGGNSKELDPGTQAVKNKLIEQEEKEKNRKERRKQQENAEEDRSAQQVEKEVPQIDIEEDLTPKEVSSPPAPKKPMPPPTI
jgi:hypothetical protein